MVKRVIGVTGKLNSGKDVLADHLTRLGYIKISMAEPMKNVLRDIFDSTVLSDDALWGPSEKRTPGARHLLQVLGTDLCRAYDPDVWVKKMITSIEDSYSDNIVIPDIRFVNEADMVVNHFKGKLIRVVRPGCNTHVEEEVAEHESETNADFIPPLWVSATLENSGTIGHFHGLIASVIKSLDL